MISAEDEPSGAGTVPPGSDGQAPAPLGPTAFDHRLSCPGTHPDTKSMGTFTSGIAGLIRSFAHDFFLVIFSGPGRSLPLS